jgi:hypothetical protein
MSNDGLFETNEYLDNDDDVISFSSDSMCKLVDFKRKIGDFFISDLPNKLVEYLENIGIKSVRMYERGIKLGSSYPKNSKWLTEGKECEILKVGSNGWKKGKIRLKITLEFIPDEPEIKQIESPLDDIRQTMNQSN